MVAVKVPDREGGGDDPPTAASLHSSVQLPQTLASPPPPPSSTATSSSPPSSPSTAAVPVTTTAPTPPPVVQMAVSGLVRSFTSATDHLSAVAYAEKLYATFPHSLRALCLYARALIQAGDMTTAFQVLHHRALERIRVFYRAARDAVRRQQQSKWSCPAASTTGTGGGGGGTTGEQHVAGGEEEEEDCVARRDAAYLLQAGDESWACRIAGTAAVLYARCLLQRRDYGRLLALYSQWKTIESSVGGAPAADGDNGDGSRSFEWTGSAVLESRGSHRRPPPPPPRVSASECPALDAALATHSCFAVGSLCELVSVLETMMARVAVFRERRDVALHLLEDAVVHDVRALGAWELLCDAHVFDQEAPALVLSEHLVATAPAQARLEDCQRSAVRVLREQPRGEGGDGGVDVVATQLILQRLSPVAAGSYVGLDASAQLSLFSDVLDAGVGAASLCAQPGLLTGGVGGDGGGGGGGGGAASDAIREAPRALPTGQSNGDCATGLHTLSSLRSLTSTVKCAEACLCVGETYRAEELCAAVLSISPFHTEALLVLGTTLVLHGNDAQLLDLVRSLHAPVLAMKNDAQLAPWFIAGCYYLCRGELEYGRSAFLRATTCAPGCAASWVAMGVCYAALEEPDQAADAWRAAAVIAPSAVSPLLMMAQERLRSRNPLQASELLSQVRKGPRPPRPCWSRT